MQTTYEPMTAKQKKELRGYASWVVRGARVVFYLLAVGFVGGCLWSIHLAFGKPHPFFSWDVWWIVPSLAFAAWLARKGKTWTGGSDGVGDIKADLADGNLAVHRIVVADAIEIEEQEDEGPSFFVLTVEKKVIYFHGQEMDGWKHKGFPWREFEIKETPRSKMLFRLKKQGEAFRPLFMRKPISYEEAKHYSGSFRGRYRILDVDFESLKINPAAANATKKSP